MWEAWSPQHSLQWSAGRTPDLFLAASIMRRKSGILHVQWNRDSGKAGIEAGSQARADY